MSHCFLHESSSGSSLAFNLTLSYIIVQMKSVLLAPPLWLSRGRSLALTSILNLSSCLMGINSFVFYPSIPQWLTTSI